MALALLKSRRAGSFRRNAGPAVSIRPSAFSFLCDIEFMVADLTEGVIFLRPLHPEDAPYHLAPGPAIGFAPARGGRRSPDASATQPQRFRRNCDGSGRQNVPESILLVGVWGGFHGGEKTGRQTTFGRLLAFLMA